MKKILTGEIRPSNKCKKVGKSSRGASIEWFSKARYTVLLPVTISAAKNIAFPKFFIISGTNISIKSLAMQEEHAETVCVNPP